MLNLLAVQGNRDIKVKKIKKQLESIHDCSQESQTERGFWTLAAIHQRPRKRNPSFDLRDRSRHEIFVSLNPRETSHLIHLFKFRQGKVS